MLPGMVVSDKNGPALVLPQDWTGQKILLKMTGGVGDSLMAIGGVARSLKQRECTVTACVMPNQVQLIAQLEGVDSVIQAVQSNYPATRNSFDVYLDFAGTFNTIRELRRGGYYTLLSKKVGLEVLPGKFRFLPDPVGEHVAIHPGSSNPNRRWSEEKWTELAYQLRDRGFAVTFFGTSDEFGFHDEGIFKASDFTEDLLEQSKGLAGCSSFVGCDSGFSHVAGMLGVPGVVLFFTTYPEDVIDKYTTLKGVSAYEKLGIVPTRSFDPKDQVSKAASDGLTVGEVLDALGVSAIECTPQERNPRAPSMRQIAVVGRCPEADMLASQLSEYYITEVVDEKPTNGDFQAVIVVDPAGFGRLTVGNKEVNLDISDAEDVRRALRELRVN